MSVAGDELEKAYGHIRELEIKLAEAGSVKAEYLKLSVLTGDEDWLLDVPSDGKACVAEYRIRWLRLKMNLEKLNHDAQIFADTAVENWANWYEAKGKLLDALERIAALEDALDFGRNRWSPVGGRACPLCHYENGVFIALCKLHEYFAEQEAEWVDSHAECVNKLSAKLAQAEADAKLANQEVVRLDEQNKQMRFILGIRGDM